MWLARSRVDSIPRRSRDVAAAKLALHSGRQNPPLRAWFTCGKLCVTETSGQPCHFDDELVGPSRLRDLIGPGHPFEMSQPFVPVCRAVAAELGNHRSRECLAHGIASVRRLVSVPHCRQFCLMASVQPLFPFLCFAAVLASLGFHVCPILAPGCFHLLNNLRHPGFDGKFLLCE